LSYSGIKWIVFLFKAEKKVNSNKQNFKEMLEDFQKKANLACFGRMGRFK